MSESLRRGVELLEELRSAETDLGVRELAERVGVPKSTVARLLKTLEDCQLAAQDPATRRYRLGPRTLILGTAYQARIDLRNVALPAMRALRDATGETVGLSVAIGAERMFIEEVASVSELRTSSELGHPYPLWSGAPGRILLASCATARRDEVLRTAGDAVFQAATPPTRDGYLDLLAEVRRDGQARAFDESVPGVSAVAVPVRDVSGEVVAALSISGPSSRFDGTAMDRVLADLRTAAATVSTRLGAPPVPRG